MILICRGKRPSRNCLLLPVGGRYALEYIRDKERGDVHALGCPLL